MSSADPPTLSQPRRSVSTSKPKGILKNAPPAPGVATQQLVIVFIYALASSEKTYLHIVSVFAPLNLRLTCFLSGVIVLTTPLHIAPKLPYLTRKIVPHR